VDGKATSSYNKWLILMSYEHRPRKLIGGCLSIKEGLNLADQRDIIQQLSP
jgi:hypothetical protein